MGTHEPVSLRESSSLVGHRVSSGTGARRAFRRSNGASPGADLGPTKDLVRAPTFSDPHIPVALPPTGTASEWRSC